MNYCMHCGTRLRMKPHETEGHAVPWCDTCGDYRFPVFNTAVSMVVTDPGRRHILLICQYGRPFYILPAGYINKGEKAEAAARRELQEELGLSVLSARPSDTSFALILSLSFDILVISVEIAILYLPLNFL